MKNEILLFRIKSIGISYESYLNDFKNIVNDTKSKNMSEKELELVNYTKLNLQRTNRIHKTLKLNNKIIEAVKLIDEPQIWMVVTEPWCGDSAQSLPYIYEISKLNPNIDLKIIYRDKNLDIIDLYLTDGKSRSIPKLVAFNESGDELFQWGPRPAEIVNQIDEWKAERLTKEEFIPMIHLWYAKNKGQSVMNEIAELING